MNKKKAKAGKAPLRVQNQKRRKTAVLEALEETRGIVVHACKKVGVSRTQFYNWMDEDEAFARRYREIQDEQGDEVEAMLLQKIDEGDTTAIIFYLKTKQKHRGYTERMELTGEDGKSLFADLTDAQLEEEITRLQYILEPQ